VLPAGVKAVPVLDYYHRPRAAPAASAWPHLRAADGTTVDASVIPERGALTRIAIVSGFTEGWYELTHANGRADRVMWDASQLPYWTSATPTASPGLAMPSARARHSG
jgi:hypothetical protein